MKRHLPGIVIGILAMIAGQSIYTLSAYHWGEFKARVDLLRGKHFILAYCDLATKRDEHNQVLRPYGIELVVVGGCRVSEGFSYEVRGYNKVSLDAVSEKYGKDFLLKILPRREDEHSKELDSRGRIPAR